MDLRPGQNKHDLEGAKQLPAECNRKPLEKRIQYTQKQVYGHKENFLLTTPAEGQEGSAGYKPPMHFANRHAPVQGHLAPVLQQQRPDLLCTVVAASSEPAG